MPLDAPGVSALGQPGRDGVPVALEISAEAAQLWRTRVVDCGDPVVQLAATGPLTDQTQELLSQLTRTDQFRTSLTKLLQQVLLLLVQIRRSAEQQPGERARAGEQGMGWGWRLGRAPAEETLPDRPRTAPIALVFDLPE